MNTDPPMSEPSVSAGESSSLPAKPQKGITFSLSKLLNPENAGPPAVASFDPADPANIQRVVEAQLPSDFKRTELGEGAFEVHHWLATWADDISSDPNIVVPGIRLTFWSPDGASMSITGTVAVKCWETVVANLGPGPYDPPLLVKIKPFRTGSGRESYGLVPQSKGRITPASDSEKNAADPNRDNRPPEVS